MTSRNVTLNAEQRRHWFCIAYAFPPIQRSGTLRTLGFVRHLDRWGWDATVLTVEPNGEPLDPSLVPLIPSSTTLLRTPWVDIISRVKSVCPVGTKSITIPRSRRSLRDWLSRLLITPDSRTGWILPAVRQGLKAIRRRRPDVIYSTSPYMSAHLIGLMLSRWFNLPWVADFRDPWRGNPFREIPYRSLDRWDAWLENLVMRRATHVVFNTPAMKDLACLGDGGARRNGRSQSMQPTLDHKSTTILNGFDSEMFSSIAPKRLAPPGDFVLTHAGEFYDKRSPKVWFSALRRVLVMAPGLAGRIRIVLIGPETYGSHSLGDLATRAGVGRHVVVLGRKSRPETLALLAGSDALMLAGLTEAPAGNATQRANDLQVPAKLFEYLALRRPIIANVRAEGSVAAILQEAGAEALLCDPNDEEGLARAIVHLAEHRSVQVDNAWAGVARFDRAHRAADLAEIFSRLATRCASVIAPGSQRSRTWRTTEGHGQPSVGPRPKRLRLGSG